MVFISSLKGFHLTCLSSSEIWWGKKDQNETDGTTGTKIDRKSWLNPTIQGLSKTGVRWAISVHNFLITQNHWKNIFLCSGTLHLAMDFGVVIAVSPKKAVDSLDDPCFD